jgi:hypothetical protein
MEPFALRYAMLRLIELQEARGATYLQDADIAAALGAAVREVQEQLEILEHDEFVECVKGFGPSYSARLTYHSPRLWLIAGQLRCVHGTPRAMSPTSVRTIPDADTVASTPESAGISARSDRVDQHRQSVLEILLHSWKGTCCSVRARVRKERVSVN